MTAVEIIEEALRLKVRYGDHIKSFVLSPEAKRTLKEYAQININVRMVEELLGIPVTTGRIFPIDVILKKDAFK